MEKTKQLLTLFLCGALLFGLAAAQLLDQDKAVSYGERRTLAQRPALTLSSLLSGSYMPRQEEYLLDQFPLRDTLRGLYSGLRLYGLWQRDVHGLWIDGDTLYSLTGPLDEAQAALAAEKINALLQGPLAGADAYYALIPDKSYYAPGSRPGLDHQALLAQLQERIEGAEYVDLLPLLSAESYYRTDLHWRQEELFPVAQALAGAMGTEQWLTPEQDYESHSLSPFRGAYLGQLGLPLEPDCLVYLTSPDTQSALVTGPELEGTEPVYTLSRFQDLDSYDLFLSGPQPFLVIECPDARSQRELVIFRDSFGSSLAPLFCGAYSRIVLVDLRYMSSGLLEDYLAPGDRDVLFLYSAGLYNSGALLR